MARSSTFGWRSLVVLGVLSIVVAFPVAVAGPANGLPIDDPIGDVRDRGENLVGGIRDRAGDAVRDVRDRGRGTVDRVEDAARDLVRAGGDAGESLGGAVDGALADAPGGAGPVQAPSGGASGGQAAQQTGEAEAAGRSESQDNAVLAPSQSPVDDQDDVDEVAEGGNQISGSSAGGRSTEAPPCDGVGLCLGILFGRVTTPGPVGAPPLSFTGLNILMAMLVASALALMGTALLATSSHLVPLPISSSGPGARRIHLLGKALLPNWPAPR